MEDDGDKYPFGSSSNLVNKLSFENTTGRSTSLSITWDVLKTTAGRNWTDSGCEFIYTIIIFYISISDDKKKGNPFDILNIYNLSNGFQILILNIIPTSKSIFISIVGIGDDCQFNIVHFPIGIFLCVCL
tara:strand:+ start:1332 stop:1721 length:390 start_codon:yes stop_codon:yes gene_type:complete